MNKLNNILRIHGDFLKKEQGKFLYEDQLFNGIGYFPINLSKIKAFIINNGDVIDEYSSVVNSYNPKIVDSIDASLNWYLNDSIDAPDFPLNISKQLYLDKPFFGVGYRFNQLGVCDAEVFFGKDAYPTSGIYWSNKVVDHFLLTDNSCPLEDYQDQVGYISKYKPSEYKFIIEYKSNQSKSDIFFLRHEPKIGGVSLELKDNKISCMNFNSIPYESLLNFLSYQSLDLHSLSDLWNMQINDYFNLCCNQMSDFFYFKLEEMIDKGKFDQCYYVNIINIDNTVFLKAIINYQHRLKIRKITLNCNIYKKIKLFDKKILKKLSKIFTLTIDEIQ